ncbi:MAG: cupin domain-containing protein [Candidatus Thorarchaeota archaeon]
MVRVYRARDSLTIESGGYDRKYVADITFREPLSSAGFIWVRIPKGQSTSPHSHEFLQEAFVSLNRVRMNVDEASFILDNGDIVVVDPDESHSFKAEFGVDVTIIAIKFPNLKSDKITK